MYLHSDRAQQTAETISFVRITIKNIKSILCLYYLYNNSDLVHKLVHTCTRTEFVTEYRHNAYIQREKEREKHHITIKQNLINP
jgi:hypothetical protein